MCTIEKGRKVALILFFICCLSLEINAINLLPLGLSAQQDQAVIVPIDRFRLMMAFHKPMIAFIRKTRDDLNHSTKWSCLFKNVDRILRADLTRNSQ